MRGHYPANGGVRLRLVCDDGQAEPVSARLFLCRSCRRQVIVCRCCDRGQVYCPDGCAGEARRQSLRAAGQRYQRTLRGRRKHAARSLGWRARQRQRVTHQGSPPPPPGDLLSIDATAIPRDDPVLTEPSRRTMKHCHWCGRRCLPQLRQDFLRRRDRRRRRLGNTRTERNAPW
jgi:hypothetical protein